MTAPSGDQHVPLSEDYLRAIADAEAKIQAEYQWAMAQTAFQHTHEPVFQLCLSAVHSLRGTP